MVKQVNSLSWRVWGYEGNDLVVSGQGDDVIYGGRSVFLVEGRSEIKDIVYDFDVYIEPFYLDDRFFDEYYEKISMVGVLVKGGDDEIYGGDGKDYIDGGSDQDALYGGQGADMIYGGDYLVLDSVQSESYIHTIENLFDYNYDYKLKQNGSILQRVFISGGNDIIFGGVGSDVINGQDGADEMYGGNDDDYIYGGRSGVVDVGYENIDVHEETTYDFYDIKDKRSTFIKEEIVFGGNDLVYAGHGLDRVYGGDGNDVLYGGVGDDYLYGGESFVLTLKRSEILDYFFDNNHMSWYDYEKTSQKDLVVNGGVDSIYGDWGNDYIDGGSDQDLIYGGEGDDHLSGGKGVALVLHESTYFYEMDDYSDVSESTEGYVSVFVSGGDDFIYGGSGSDYIDGCDGNDVLYGGNQNDVIYGGLDQDYVMMSWSVKDQAELKELLHVSGGDDVLFGGDGSDIIYGKNGSDKIDGGAGVDLMYGGDGSDFYLVDDAKDQIIEFDDQGNDSVESAFSHSLGDNVENLILLSGYSAYNGSGNQLDNAINGNELDNRLIGKGGDDVMSGKYGNDKLYGGMGSDVLDGGVGADLMAGSFGDDVYYKNHVNDKIVELDGQGVDALISSINTRLDNFIENLSIVGRAVLAVGNDSDNYISGNDQDNVIDGRGGADVLRGMAGNDTYIFKRGYGEDVIIDTDSSSGNQDLIQFGSLIDASQLWFSRIGQDLNILVIGTENTVRIKDWYNSVEFQVERFELSNGQTLNQENVPLLVQAMASLTPPALGQTELDASLQNQLAGAIDLAWS